MRTLRARAWTLLFGLALLPGSLRAAPPVARSVVGVRMSVSDLDAARDFYVNVLQFVPAGEPVEFEGDAAERRFGVFPARVRLQRLRLGTEEVELVEFLAPRGRPASADAQSDDRSFQHVAIVVSDMKAAYRRLRAHRVAHVSPAPQRLPDWNPNAGGIEAFYFRDPDGHPLEVIAYPAGRGQARWQSKERLFLGIDHTAIVVSDTDRSLRFWRDTLGLAVAGESENWGVEQERLNAVFGARLRISGLKAAAGIGVEFLEYLAPRSGRPSPADARPNDLLSTVTRLGTGSARDAEAALRAGRAAFVSPGAVGPTVTVRDPDGHLVEVAEESGAAAAAPSREAARAARRERTSRRRSRRPTE